MKPEFKKFLTGIVLAGCLGAPVFADVNSAAQDVVDCRSLADDSAKLACFEAAAASLEASLGAAPEQTMEQVEPVEQVEQVAPNVAADAKLPIWARLSRSSQEKQAKKAKKKDRPSESKELEVTVVKIVRNNIGRHYLTFDNGQVWRQSQPGEIEPPSALPAPGRIRRALVGNPWFEFDEHPTTDFKIIRVK
nr:hypothetical protein [uncultured Hyphomonas sp.]